jgi:hypothetical protein
MGKGRPARKARNLIAICELIVRKMWKPRRLTALWDSIAGYRDSYIFFYVFFHYDNRFTLFYTLFNANAQKRQTYNVNI